MKTNRLIAGGVALALVAALGGLAVVAGRDSGGEPAALPVLGAGGDATTEAMADSDMRVGGRIEYRARGALPALDGEADAWHVAAGEVTVDRITALAERLGVDGEVRRSEFGWTVGSDARRLDVQDVAGNPWSLYETIPAEEIAPDGTAHAEAEARRAEELEGGGSSGSTGSSGGTSSSDMQVAPAPDCAADACDEPQFHEPERPADLPSKDEAERIGRQVLVDLGIDLDRAVVRIDDAITLWNVNADPEIGGLRTMGLTTSVGIGPKGVIQYGNGWLGEFTKGDRYPLIGTAAGIERLGDDQARTLMIDPVPGAPEGGDGVDAGEEPEPLVIEITDVHLGLQLFSTYEPGADGYLVPSYFFATADGGEIPVLAIADEYLVDAHVDHGHDDGDEPHGTPAEPDEPVGPSEPFPAQETCAGAAQSGIEANACVSSGRVGQPVRLLVTAKGTIRDDCASPVAEWGESDEGTAVCAIGCESLPPEPIELERTFEHVYDRPGTYTITVYFRGCGEESAVNQLELPVEVRVEG